MNITEKLHAEVDVSRPLTEGLLSLTRVHCERRGFNKHGIRFNDIHHPATVWVGHRITSSAEASVLARIDSLGCMEEKDYPRIWFVGVLSVHSSMYNAGNLTAESLALRAIEDDALYYGKPESLHVCIDNKLQELLPLNSLTNDLHITGISKL